MKPSILLMEACAQVDLGLSKVIHNIIKLLIGTKTLRNWTNTLGASDSYPSKARTPTARDSRPDRRQVPNNQETEVNTWTPRASTISTTSTSRASTRILRTQSKNTSIPKQKVTARTSLEFPCSPKP